MAHPQAEPVRLVIWRFGPGRQADDGTFIARMLDDPWLRGKQDRTAQAGPMVAVMAEAGAALWA